MEGDTKIKVHCNRCGAETFHRLLVDKTLWGWFEQPVQPADDFIDHPDEADWREDYELLQCCGCEDVCLRHSASDISMPPDFGPTVHFYPARLFRKRPKWFSDLPRDLMAVLDEVYSALATDSRRLAVMGVRAAIEMIMSDKVGDQPTFFKKLDALEATGFVGRANREQLAAVLDVGHAAAHRGHAPSVEDLEHVMDILENLLMAAYQLQDVAGKLRGNTPRRYPRGV